MTTTDLDPEDDLPPAPGGAPGRPRRKTTLQAAMEARPEGISPTFAPRRDASPSLARAAFAMAELTYHATVREVRKGHRNALAGLLMSMVQTVIMLATFYIMFAVLGSRTSPIRGDYILYLLSGIVLFMVHTKAIGAVVRAEGAASPMMQHAPLNTTITMAAGALSALYLQMLTLLIILFIYDVAWAPVEIEDPMGCLGMVMIAWLSGVGVGLIFAALKPWFPEGAVIASSIYSRLNMVASGKMFVANTLPGRLLWFFWWNPLFHVIDQLRGYMFLNYSPHVTNWEYPLWVGIGLIVVGLMAEAYTRKHASLSWRAGA